MPFKINENECLACGFCADVCPAGAIDIDDSNDFYFIDPELCVECGTCADECPNCAITGGEYDEEEDEDNEEDDE